MQELEKVSARVEAKMAKLEKIIGSISRNSVERKTPNEYQRQKVE